MKIAVVGTSNSVLTNGYTPIYQAIEYPHQVDNYSLGGTICQFIPFALEKYGILKTYDFLVTDCCPNDSDSFFHGQRTADWFYNELFTILSTIKETQIKHLHLIFPFQHSQFLQKMHVQICEELTIPYLDIGTILSPLAEQAKQDIFQDIHHIAPFFAKPLAYLIKAKRKEIFENPSAPSPHTSITKKYSYYDLVKNFQNKYSSITRSTSLLSENFIRIKNQQELCIDKLPSLNLEGLCYYTNKEAGIYNLSSGSCVRNYSLYFPTADYIYYQPMPQESFPVQSSLKIQSGFNKKSPAVIIENTTKPERNNYSELWISSLLFSKDISAPLKWEEKNYARHGETDRQLFEKIYFTLIAMKNTPGLKTAVPNEYIFIAANLFPQSPHIRKCYTAMLKSTNNPYYFYYFAKLYLVPRKKYTYAVKVLEKALQIKEHILFMELLAACYLEKKLFAKTLTLISKKMPAKNITTYKLYCSLAAAMQNKVLFFQNAQKILSCNSHIDYLLFLASSCIQLKAFQEAITLLNTALEEKRNFRPDNTDKNMARIQKLMQEIKEQN